MPSRYSFNGYLFAFLGLLMGTSAWSQESTRPVEGLRENIPAVHALVNATIVISPGQRVDRGTLILRDGVIDRIGPDVAVPGDAKTWDLTGHFIYPGFIDAYSEVAKRPATARQATSYWSADVQPGFRVADHHRGDESLNQSYREQGFTSRLVAPDRGIIRGVSALCSTSDLANDRVVIEPRVALHVRLTTERGGDEYPNSPMGAVALARQFFYDVSWYREVWKTYHSQPGLPRPEQNSSLAEVEQYLSSNMPMVLNTSDEQYLLRADEFAREFGLRAIIVGSGHEYRRLEDVRATGRPVIVPLDFPKPPDVATPEAEQDATMEDLMHWDHAPENPARLHAAGIPFALTAFALPKISEFLPALRKAVQRGLPPDAALAAITTSPATLLGVDDRLGKLERGTLAHLTITSGDLFHPDSRVVATWIDGRRYEVKPGRRSDPQGRWPLTAAGRVYRLDLKRDNETWTGEISTDDEHKAELKRITVEADQLNATFSAAPFAREGTARLSATIVSKDNAPRQLIGRIRWPDGTDEPFTATWGELPPAETTPAVDPTTAAKEPESTDQPSEPSPTTAPQATDSVDVRASYPVNYPLGDFGWEQIPEQPSVVVFEHATVWTCGPAGKLADATVVVRAGIIESVGTGTPIPSSAIVVDCQGRHITPGIIDCHSHMATDGGVNEATQAITAEVRIGDFIDARDISIYRQLAGGVTAANILHGSANPIGGQNQVIKLRWGMSPTDMKFREAPPGIKFALGENVKQSNRSDRSNRYPQTRMGVEQIIRDALLAARQYRDRMIDWQQTRKGLPPRKDLELDALVEVLEQRRWIHCHSYRQDEILAFLRTLESFQIQVGTLQHILEGYKLADIMKRHGAAGSAFSDWWAYKFEVFDAIPYNGSLMHHVGVNVSFNSDDQELARHLNHEAAKAVKYGGLAPEEALKFVTWNPAQQLRIDRFVGSIEAGKQADLVVWSGDPLSTRTRCEQTWIDGRKYFSLEQHSVERQSWQAKRSTLVQKILKSGETPANVDDKKPEVRDLWPREDIYCRHRGS